MVPPAPRAAARTGDRWPELCDEASRSYHLVRGRTGNRVSTGALARMLKHESAPAGSTGVPNHGPQIRGTRSASGTAAHEALLRPLYKLFTAA